MSDVRVVTAGEVGRFKGGSGFPLRFQGGKSGRLPYFKVSDMNIPGNELFMRTANNYISEATRKRLGAVRLPAGSIVFAKVGAAIYLERKRILETDGCIDNNMAAFIVDPGRVDVRFAHYLLSDFKLSSLVATTALPSLNGAQLRSIQLRLPPIKEQRRIAAALGAVDDEIASIERLMTKMRAIKQGLSQALLTGRTRLAEFTRKSRMVNTILGGLPTDWEIVMVPDVVVRSADSIKIGPFGSALKKAFLTDQGFKVYGQENVYERDMNLGSRFISEDRFRQLRSCEVLAGDFLVSMMGTVGQTHIVPSGSAPGIMDSHLLRLRLDASRIDASFLEQVFGTPTVTDQIKQLAVGGIMDGLSSSIIRRLCLPLPSRTEQSLIAEVLDTADAEIRAVERQLDATFAIKRGMMQELVSGRTRLIEEDAA